MDLLRHSGGIAAGAFLTALFSTVFCTAVNCYTYRLAYPLWRKVHEDDFAALHREYLRQLNPIITAPHIILFFSSGALLLWRPPMLSLSAALVGFSLNTAVILVSAFVAGPVHDRFTRRQRLEPAGLRRLIQISALRSILMLTASAVYLGALWFVLIRS